MARDGVARGFVAARLAGGMSDPSLLSAFYQGSWPSVWLWCCVRAFFHGSFSERMSCWRRRAMRSEVASCSEMGRPGCRKSKLWPRRQAECTGSGRTARQTVSLDAGIGRPHLTAAALAVERHNAITEFGQPRKIEVTPGK